MVGTDIVSVTRQIHQNNSYSVAFAMKVIQYNESVESRSISDTEKEFQLPVNTVKSFLRSRNNLKQHRPQENLNIIKVTSFYGLECILGCAYDSSQ